VIGINPSIFYRHQGLQYHVATVHQSTTFTCGECGRQFSSKKVLSKHLKTVNCAIKKCMVFVSPCGARLKEKRYLKGHRMKFCRCVIMSASQELFCLTILFVLWPFKANRGTVFSQKYE
jgi:hypothetical protein